MNNYTFIAPVQHVIFAKTYSPKELRIGRVIFVARASLPYIRKRLGIQVRLSSMEYKNTIDPTFLKRTETYAIVQLHAVNENTSNECFGHVRDALNILGVSLLGWSKRRFHTLPLMFGFSDVGRFEYLVLNNSAPRQLPGWSILGVPSPMILNSRWKEYHKGGFFFNLLNIINREVNLTETWRMTLEQAAILAGQSQSSKSLIQAFLWNMIVLEMLLSRQGDKYTITLPKRIESFIGWVGYWKSEDYEDRIQGLYKKRNALVHDGNHSELRIEDLLFSDDLVLNIFDNIVNHIHLFQSKDDVIRFSDKVEAEHILGIRSKTQPKTLRSVRRQYDDADLKELF